MLHVAPLAGSALAAEHHDLVGHRQVVDDVVDVAEHRQVRRLEQRVQRRLRGRELLVGGQLAVTVVANQRPIRPQRNAFFKY